MEDFYYAGGLRGAAPAARRSAARRLRRRSTAGRLARTSQTRWCSNDEVIAHARNARSVPKAAWRCCAATSRPSGAVIKHTAAEPRLLQHAGPAVVFRDYDDMDARIDDPVLPVTADSVLVLQNAGPLGGPGMPEWGMLPIPEEAAGAGRARHGAGLRRAHERHELRRLRPARRAGVVRRRPAGARAGWRHHRARRRRRAGSSLRVGRRGARGDAGSMDSPGRRISPRLRPHVLPACHARPTKAAISISSKARRPSPILKFTDVLTGRGVPCLNRYMAPATPLHT